MVRIVFTVLALLGTGLLWAQELNLAPDKAPPFQPMTAEETRAFMKKLAQYVFDHHLRKDEKSAMRGMIYEYHDVGRQGQFDQFVQGEALDTMHDGAWFAAALVNAYRATGDPYYKDFLTQWVLPFYCKMLNHSDTLFRPQGDDSRPKVHRFDKEHALQPGEKGFVPYWWDDGGSVSLERRRDRNPLGPFSCTDYLAGKDNRRFLLDGFSHGSSNHLAQDLGVMLELSWLLLRESSVEKERQYARVVAEAAQNLHLCRLRHHGHIPMCTAPAALALHSTELMKLVPDQSTPAGWVPGNHYFRALYDFQPGQRLPFPGFADDQQYRYYTALARHGGEIPKALAFRTVFDAYTESMLYRYYSDDAVVLPGINRFDLHPYYARDGRLEDYRSQRQGPGGQPRPIGSRLGPQNMVCCGWALQLLNEIPGLWEDRHRRYFRKDVRVILFDAPSSVAFDLKTPLTDLVLGGMNLHLLSRRHGLDILGDYPADEAVVRIFSRPEGEGSHAVITLKKDQPLRAVNERGEELLIEGKCRAADKGLEFQLYLPYTVVKGQKAWANGVEHGRYSLQVGQATRNFYLSSLELQVKWWLEHELAGGLRTWEAIFREKGCIPTGLGAGGDWDRFSDSGGYAHLLSAASQWLLFLEGKKDWEVHRVPEVPLQVEKVP